MTKFLLIIVLAVIQAHKAQAQTCNLGLGFAINGKSPGELLPNYTEPVNTAGCHLFEAVCYYDILFTPQNGGSSSKSAMYCGISNLIDTPTNQLFAQAYCEGLVGIQRSTPTTEADTNKLVNDHLVASNKWNAENVPLDDPRRGTLTNLGSRCYPFKNVAVPPSALAESPDPKQTCENSANGSLPAAQSGSQVDCRDRNLRQSIPILGTDFALNYSARETPGADPANGSFSVVVSSPTGFHSGYGSTYGNITTINVTVNVLDVVYSQTVTVNAPVLDREIVVNFTWNGKNKAGTLVNGVQQGKATITYNLEKRPGAAGAAKFTKTRFVTVSRSNNLDRFKLGGWSLSAYHKFDPTTKTVFTGHGLRLGVENKANTPSYVPNSSGYIFVPSEDASELFQFNSTGQHLQTLDSLKGTVLYTFQHDASGRLTSIRDRDGLITTIRRDTSGNLSGIVGPYGDTTVVTLNSNGWIASIANPNNETTSFTYFAAPKTGLMATYKNPAGNQKSYTFDSKGYLTQITDFNLGNKILSATNSMGMSGPLSTTTLFKTPMGRTFNYTTTINSDDSVIHTNYAPDGSYDTIDISSNQKQKRISSRDGSQTTIQLTQSARFPERFSASNVTISRGGVQSTVSSTETASYQTVGLPTSLMTYSRTDELESVGKSVFTYTKSNNTQVQKSPGGKTLTTAFNGFGRPISMTLGNLSPITYTYDANGRLTQVKQSTRTYSLAYDTKGLVSSVTNAAGKITRFTYDNARRVKLVTLPNAKTIGFTYDVNGNAKSVALPNAQPYSYTFDKKDLPLTNSEPSIAGSSFQWSWEYNLDAELIKSTYPDASLVTFNYDEFGRLVTISAPGISRTITYSGSLISSIQSSASDLIQYSWSGGLPQSYAWSGAVNGSVLFSWGQFDMLNSIAINDQNQINYSYTSDQEISAVNDLSFSRSSSTGLMTGSTIGGIATTLTRNSFGELTGYSVTAGSSPLVAFTYTRDSLGRISSMARTESGVTTTKAYTYDDIGQLLSETTNGANAVSYTYDSNGNRTTTGGSQVYDSQDRLSSDASWTYTYNRSGYLIKKAHKTNGSITNYSYDNLGNLLKVTQTGKAAVDYIIDGEDRRIQRRVGGVIKESFLYLDSLRPVAQLDSAGNVVATFVYGSTPHSPDLIIKGNVTYRVISDHLGSPLFIVNTSTNAVAQKITYDTWGRVLSDSNPGFQPFGFAGGLYDTTTGLIRFGARDYDPSIGRWLNKDPIRFEGGWNLYTYVGNDSLNRIDPTGLIDLNLYPPSESIFNNYEKVPSSRTYYSVGLHGNPDEVLNGETLERMDPNELARWIEADPDFKKRPVKLDSCSTGRIGSQGASFGQRLANRLGVPVYAPTTDVNIANGQVVPQKPGRWILFKPKK